MALDLVALNANFLEVLRMPTTNTEQYTSAYMATIWTNTYDSYSRQATDALGNSVTGMNPEGFKAQLNYAFARSQYGVIVLSDITTAVNIYWTGVTLSLSSLPPGGIAPVTNVVQSTPGDFTCDLGLTTDLSTAAQRVSNAFHNKTTRVTTLFSYIHAGIPPYAATYQSTLY